MEDLRARIAEQSVTIAQHEDRIRELERRVKLIDDWIF